MRSGAKATAPKFTFGRKDEGLRSEEGESGREHILMARTERMSPMVNAPVSPMNILECLAALPNTL